MTRGSQYSGENIMRIINAKLIIEDTCNPSDDEAIKYVVEILNEIFGKEEQQEYPRCKLILMEVNTEHKNDRIR